MSNGYGVASDVSMQPLSVDMPLRLGTVAYLCLAITLKMATLVYFRHFGTYQIQEEFRLLSVYIYPKVWPSIILPTLFRHTPHQKKTNSIASHLKVTCNLYVIIYGRIICTLNVCANDLSFLMCDYSKLCSFCITFLNTL